MMTGFSLFTTEWITELLLIAVAIFWFIVLIINLFLFPSPLIGKSNSFFGSYKFHKNKHNPKKSNMVGDETRLLSPSTSKKRQFKLIYFQNINKIYILSIVMMRRTTQQNPSPPSSPKKGHHIRHVSSPYLQPFQSIVKETPSQHNIQQRTIQLQKMKQKLQELVKQTDQLDQNQKNISMRKRQNPINPDFKLKIQSNQQLTLPPRNFNPQKYFSPKYEPNKQALSFKGRPSLPNQQKFIPKQTHKLDELKASETQECLSLGSSPQNIQKKEDFNRMLTRPIFSQGSSQFSMLIQRQNARRKSALDLQSQSISSSRQSNSKQPTSYSPQRSEILSPKIQILCLEQQIIKLKEQVENLNRSRQYYQKQLAAQLKREEQIEDIHKQKLVQQRKKYQVIINGYLDQIEEKQATIKKLMDKLIHDGGQNQFQHLLQRLKELSQENDQLNEDLIQKSQENSTLKSKIQEQILTGEELISQNALIQEQLSELKDFKSQYILHSNILTFDQALRIQISQIDVLKKQVEELLEKNESLKLEMREMLIREDQLVNEEKITKMKENSKRNNLQTQHSIELTQKQNLIRTLQKKVITLEQKYKSSMTENHEKDQFIRNFIQSRAHDIDVEELLTSFEQKIVRREEKEQALKSQIEELKERIKIYQQINT